MVVAKRFPGEGGGMSESQESSQSKVVIDEKGVLYQRPTGEVESVAWAELKAVLIETTDAGPFGPDVFWILIGVDESGQLQGCLIPQGTEGDGVLLERLRTLPGFDNEAFLAAMGSASSQRFVLWERA